MTKKNAFHLEGSVHRKAKTTVCAGNGKAHWAEWRVWRLEGWASMGPESPARIWTVLEAMGMLKCSNRKLARWKRFFLRVCMFLAL